MTRPTPTSSNRVAAAGATHVGKVRADNEDAMIVDHERGLFAVLDGMGGANAGDIASQTARDAILSYVAARRMSLEPKPLLEAAIQNACAAVHGAGQAHRERQGMGTTVVACLIAEPRRVVIGHVGDSRAYLLRSGRLQAVTRDHTIVEELVGRGMLAAEEIERHPYKNVLSRNLGARAQTRVDLLELELRAGDRLLLCSDGLYGYCSPEAMQYVLGSGDDPQHVARDLIELALRGGGGDNVTAIVIEVPAQLVARTTIEVSNSAKAWWQRRQRFLQIAAERGLTKNPIVRGLPANEALELVGMSLCQAVYHDLEKSTGVNVWTFTQNLAGGWFDRDGAWEPIRSMFDVLGETSRQVIDDIRTSEPQLGYVLDVAVNRALVVAELALGGLLSERLRQIDADLIAMQEGDTIESTPDMDVDSTGERWVDRPTIPFLRPERPVTAITESTEVMSAIERALTIARARTSPRAELVKRALAATENIASEGTTSFATAVTAARELYGQRPLDETNVGALFDAIEDSRQLAVSAVRQIQGSDGLKVRVLRTLCAAHQRLVGATTGLVLQAASPVSERLREAQVVTSDLRDHVARAERRRAELERRFATNADFSLPWGSRGTTEW